MLGHVRLAYSPQLPRRVLMCMVLLTTGIWGLSLWGYHHWSKQHRIRQQHQLTMHIAMQFKRYESVLLGCRSLYQASNEVTQSEWSDFMQGMDVHKNYPALTDFAIINFNKQPLSKNQNKAPIAILDADWQATISEYFRFQGKHQNIVERFDTSNLIRTKIIECAQNNQFACLPNITTWKCTKNSSTIVLPYYKKQNTFTQQNSPLENLAGWLTITINLNTLLDLSSLKLDIDDQLTLVQVDKQLRNNMASLDHIQASVNGNTPQNIYNIAGAQWAIQVSNDSLSEKSIVLFLINGMFFTSLTISLLISGLLGASMSSHQHAMQIIAVKSKALVESEQRTRMILDSANEAFFACGFSGHIVDWSKQAQKLFGFTRDQIIGRTLTQTIFTKSTQQDGMHGGLRDIFCATETGQRIELTAQDQSGKTFPVELSISPMHTPEGFVFNAFVHEISSRKEMQAQLAHAQKLESIGELAAGIAHEINTPTQYVGDNTRFLQESFAEITEVQTAFLDFFNKVQNNEHTPELIKSLEEKLNTLDLEFLNEEIPSAISQSLDGIHRVAEIVRSMKNFAHPGAEHKQLSDLNQAIQSTSVVSRNVWKYSAELTMDLDPDLQSVNCTPGEINQVILNLIVNATHAIEDKQKQTGDEKLGKITICTKSIDQHIQIQITDSGMGIPESIRDRIFDPFCTTKEVGQGTGQGLAIARTVIVEKHQGEISFETEDGVGTTFTILLPLDSEISPPQTEQTTPVNSPQATTS